MELDEDRRLGPEDLGDDGTEDEVDGAQRVAPRHVQLSLLESRDEDDRGVLGGSPLADQRRRLEPVHIAHPDVEQDQREVLPEQQTECLAARTGLDDRLPERRQHRLQRDQLGGRVVDDQDLRLGVGHYVCNQERRRASSCSGSTGLAM